MVYARRYTLEWLSGQMEAPLVYPVPEATAPDVRPISAAPMMWVGNGNFQIGQRSQSGGWTFYGESSSEGRAATINVTDMTPEQLEEAARTLVYDLKREIIGQQQWKMMLDIVNRSDTIEAFWDGVNAEPYLNMEETPFYDGLLADRFNTIALITAEINRMLSRVNQAVDALKVAQTMIADLGGPAPVAPVRESTIPSEIDGIKRRVEGLEREVEEEPYTAPAEEAVPEEGHETLPEYPTLPEFPTEPSPENMQAYWVAMHAYHTDLVTYRDALDFNIGWALEHIRVCLRELEAASVRGTQTDNYKENLESLKEMMIYLEEQGVFYD